MSKKNNKDTKRRRHEYDKRCEAEAKEKKEKVQLKKAEKKIDKDQPIHKKKKAFRIRKGVQLRGIKIHDATSKKKVRKLLAQEQAMKMAIDDEPSQKKSRGVSVKTKAVKTSVKSKAGSSKKGDAAEEMVIG